MRVMFVALGAEQLSVSLLGAVLRRSGHVVGLAFSPHLFDDHFVVSMPALARIFNDDRHVLDQISRFRPDVVCFSALTINLKWMLGIARQAKDLCGAKIVFGGVHASAVPEVLAEEEAVDFVCVGEGDVALPWLLECLRRGTAGRPMPNIVFRAPDGRIVSGRRLPFFQELDRLPGFEKDLWTDHVRLDVKYLTMSSRGCPFRCTFCFNSFFATLPGRTTAETGSYVRQRSVDHFLSELREAKRRYRVRYVNIDDDIFTLDTSWMREFSARYRREVGVPFECLSQAQFLNREKVEALREAGCAQVQLGVQTMDDGYKSGALKRYENEAHIDRALDLLEKAGIPYELDHMLGFHGEKPDAQEKALQFYARHRPHRVTTFRVSYYPGAEIVQTALRQGVLRERDVADLNRGGSDGVYFVYGAKDVRDPRAHRLLLAYEILFRGLPFLPRGIRSRVRARHLAFLPAALLGMFIALIEVAAVLSGRYPRYRRYLLNFLHFLENNLRRRFGAGPRRRFGTSETNPVRDASWDRCFEREAAHPRFQSVSAGEAES